MKTFIAFLCLTGIAASPAVAELPDGYWTVADSQPLLDATLRVELDPDLENLTAAESLAVGELIAAGRIMHTLYETQLHKDAAAAKAALDALHASGAENKATSNLLDLYYLFKGPIGTTLTNERTPFLPAAGEQAGKNVYPFGLEREEIDAWLAASPDAAGEILAVRTVVRRATAANVTADLEQLAAHPEIDVLHPGLRQRLETLGTFGNDYYAVPYALAYADELAIARQHLEAAAAHVQAESPDFTAYLRNRGRDFLSGNYESGDASWVSGDFAGLNIQIGSYETYNDNLRGVKAFYSASILARDEQKSRELEAAMAELQAIEDSLPYAAHKTVRRHIPVGVYNVIADFGQARGANTATILPNNPDHARKYGRTILMRYNIMTNDAIFANRKLRFDAVLDADFRDHLTKDGGFNRTLWHEVGHYLGVSKTADGRDLDAALADRANLFEEMKADLVSLYAAPKLREMGYHDDEGLRAHYADGIRRTLQNVQPRPQQAYQNMQLMQFNYYMEAGLLEANPETGLLTVDYGRYHDVVTNLLGEVLEIQYSGDYGFADAFVKRWNYWDDNLHGGLAERINNSGSYRRTMVRYRALAGD